MIYLDNSATTKPNANMLNAAREEVRQVFGNPSSLHDAGQNAKDLLHECREKVAESINARPSEIVFTSGGTEANSIVMNGFENRMKIISEVEHSSVANCKPEFMVPVGEDCLLDLEHLEDLVKAFSPVIVSVMLANNETGTILDPEGRLSELKEKYGFLLHVDAVQAFGKMEIDVEKSEFDFLSISAHKCHGLKGAGALYVSRKLADDDLPKALFIGGSHERGLRPGTENQIGIYSLAYMADKITNDEFYKKRLAAVAPLRDKLEALLEDIADVNGSKEHRIGFATNLFFKGLGGTKEDHLDYFLADLSESGLCVSGKSACASGMPAPSRVLRKMFGENAPQVYNSIRVSLSVTNTECEVKEAARIMRECHNRCKEIFGESNE